MVKKPILLFQGIVLINALLVKLGMEDKENVMNRFDKLKEITDRFNIYIDK